MDVLKQYFTIITNMSDFALKNEIMEKMYFDLEKIATEGKIQYLKY